MIMRNRINWNAYDKEEIFYEEAFEGLPRFREVS